MNSLFQKLLKTTAPLVNSQLTSGSLKPHFSVVDLQINSSFHTSRERYFRPGLIQLKQGDSETKSTKNFKNITFRNKIEQHDLQSKVNNIAKWLKKGHQVKAVIQNFNDLGKSENLFETLVKELDGKGLLGEKSINQKDLRFTISPAVEMATKEDK